MATQLIHLCAALLLLLAFAMLAQRRVANLVGLLAAQGLALAVCAATVGAATGLNHPTGGAPTASVRMRLQRPISSRSSTADR